MYVPEKRTRWGCNGVMTLGFPMMAVKMMKIHVDQVPPAFTIRPQIPEDLRPGGNPMQQLGRAKRSYRKYSINEDLVHVIDQ